MDPEPAPDEMRLEELTDGERDTPEDKQSDAARGVPGHEGDEAPRHQHRPHPEDGQKVYKGNQEREEQGVTDAQKGKPEEHFGEGDAHERQIGAEIHPADARNAAFRVGEPLARPGRKERKTGGVNPFEVKTEIGAGAERDGEGDEHPRRRRDEAGEQGREVRREVPDSGADRADQPRADVARGEFREGGKNALERIARSGAREGGEQVGEFPRETHADQPQSPGEGADEEQGKDETHDASRNAGMAAEVLRRGAYQECDAPRDEKRQEDRHQIPQREPPGKQRRKETEERRGDVGDSLFRAFHAVASSMVLCPKNRAQR